MDLAFDSDSPGTGAAERIFCRLLAGSGTKGRHGTGSLLSEDAEQLERLLLGEWQVLPETASALQEIGEWANLGDSFVRRIENCRLVIVAFTKAQAQAGREVLAALSDRGIQHSTLKGTAAAYLLYPSPWQRSGWDIDIGVPPSSTSEAESVALKCGFQRAQLNQRTHRFAPANAILRTVVESRHHELGFLVKKLRVTNLDDRTLEALSEEDWARRYWWDIDSDAPWCYATVDIHHGISSEIGLADLLETTNSVPYDGLPLRVPSDSWLAAHLVYKIYWEGVHSYRKGLYQYADLVRLVPRMTRESFDESIEILDRFGLEAAGHYVLRRLPNFGVQLPGSASRFLEGTLRPDPETDPVAANDLGDMWAKLWGVR